ncbi:FIST N-terminal domain-containing protein [Devosia algicola]|uniref:FIST N-terminal domain-containing protein n=1 Tax=Devosia algicola TaxID=3026418 RepID=A0ABY7YP25_9HYPH|nr:FIST N-terminal domain-containing protein [Devosia algicola]WDR03056.1 FIST N-terminal domain-containing protein [Devosia algicola]
MVRLNSVMVSANTTEMAIAELANKLGDTDVTPNFVYAFYGCAHDDNQVLAFLKQRFPGAALLGGTSCSGVMTQAGLGGAESVGLLMIEDAEGSYGSSIVELGDDPAAAAETALLAALEAADCPNELPELVWVYQAPGQEEAVIAGLRRIVGDRCPVIGGSSADDTVAGNWRQLGPDRIMTNGLVVGVLFSSGGIGFAFQGGYEPSGQSGIVTRIGFDTDGKSGIVTESRGRHILAIDNQPAAQTYNNWIGGGLTERLAEGGNILADTTMFPLGIDSGNINEVSHYLLVHPDAITPEGGLSTFAEVEEGTRIYSMRGEKRRLVDRAGRVASMAAASLPDGIDSLAGGVVVYCGGCMLAVGDGMSEVSKTVAESFSDTPFLGCFTFGEQGLILGKNVHGNLMISAIAFGQ